VFTMFLALVIPRWRVFISKTCGQCEFRRHAPRIIDIVGLAGGSELREGQCHGIGASGAVSCQKVGKGVAAGIRNRVPCHGSIKEKLPARELIAVLVIAVALDFQAKPKRVLAQDPGEIVNPLKRRIRQHERSARRIAKCADAIRETANLRDAPTEWVRRGQTWNAQKTDDVVFPASSVPATLWKSFTPNRNSFTFVGDKTRVFEVMACLPLVTTVPPFWNSPCAN
jgi:hypothetical protein